MAEKFRALITDRFDIEAYAMLKGDPRFDIVQTASPTPTVEELAMAEALVIRSRTRIDSELLLKAPKLQVIITATSGFDHIDLEATEARKLAVMYTPEANAASACELTWALVLACARRIPEAQRAIKGGEWKREALNGRELTGKTYGIVGLGRIGSRVAKVALAMGMKVIALDPYKEEEHFAAVGATRVSLEEIIRLSDVISFHVPSTPETQYLLGRNFLESMNPEVILVNTSRGSLVSEKDLIEAVASRWIAACGLDVFEREPLTRQSQLLSFPNVVLTPHLGATTREAFAASSREAAEKLQAFVAKGTVADSLPPQEPWWAAGFGRTAPAGKS